MKEGLGHAIAYVFLDIAIVIVAARLMGALFRRIGQPAVLGEITAGVLLGPTLLGAFPGHLDMVLFPPQVRPYLQVIAQLGLVLFMFIVGLELDMSLVRGRERAAMVVSLASVALPFGLGLLAAVVLYPRHNTVNGQQIDFLPLALFLGVAIAITAFPVLARILSERDMHRIPIGVLSLACAAINDVIAWGLLAFVVAIAVGGSLGGVALLVVETAAFAAFVLLVVRPMLARLVDRYERAGRLSPDLLAVVLVGVLTSAYVTEAIGVHAIFGAFLFGAAMPRRGAQALTADILKQVEQVSVLLLLPVFFVVAGLGVDITGLGSSGLWQLGLILLVAVAGKFLGAVGAARMQGMPRRQAGALGVLMNTRGLTELVILSVGLQLGVLDNQLYTMLVVMALVTTAMTGPLLNLVYPVRQVRADIAAAQRAQLETPNAYTVLVALDRGDEELVQLACELVGEQRPASMVLTRLLPSSKSALEVGGGMAMERADRITAASAELRGLATIAEDRGIFCQPISQYSTDRRADLAVQADNITADLVVLSNGGDFGAEPGRYTRAAVRMGSRASGPLVVLVVDDGPTAATALRLGAHVAAHRGTPVFVLGSGGWRAGRRAEQAIDALRRGGVSVEPADNGAVATAGLLIVPAGAALPAEVDPTTTVIAVTAGETEMDVEGLAAAWTDR